LTRLVALSSCGSMPKDGRNADAIIKRETL
jgi:hypothetical protein